MLAMQHMNYYKEDQKVPFVYKSVTIVTCDMRGVFGGEASLEYSIHQIPVEKLKFYMVHKFVATNLCTLKIMRIFVCKFNKCNT